jgi:trimethylamine---corrinoid protein Co-methyltransferase
MFCSASSTVNLPPFGDGLGYGQRSPAVDGTHQHIDRFPHDQLFGQIQVKKIVKGAALRFRSPKFIPIVIGAFNEWVKIKNSAGVCMMNFRPKLSLLGNEDVERIISGAYDLLATTGVMIKHDEALKILSDHGASVDFSTQIVKIPQDLVERCIKTVPSSLEFFHFEGDETVKLKGDTVNFVLDSAPLYLLDSETKKIRTSSTRDMVDIIKLVDNLAHVSCITACVVPDDVPIGLCDVIRFHQTLVYSNKPVFGGAFSIDGLLAEIELLSVLAGGKEKMQKRPRVFMAANPSAPLMWSQTSAGNLVDCAKNNIPLMIIPIPLSGGTVPVTLAGTMVEHTAECLSGIVISQCVKVGAPIIYGGGATPLDMLEGINAEGAIETKMLAVANNAQIGKYFNLPTAANCGRSDAMMLDAQAATESGFGMLLGALAGINMIRGVGMLDHGGAVSMEKMVFDNEVCGMILRLIDGITVTEETLAVDLIKENSHGASDILGSEHTLDWFKKELFYPSEEIISRTSYGKYVENGSKEIFERARGKKDQILNHYKAPAIDPHTLGEMKRILKEYAKKKGEIIPESIFNDPI